MLRIGIVGLDSTHAVAFTELFNAPASAHGRVVAAAHGVETDFPLSVARRAGIAREVTERLGVPLAASLEELVAAVDAVMILSADGRAHRAEAGRVLPAGKPTFIDKPLAPSAREGAEIFQIAREQRAPCFSASALRFSPEIRALREVAGGRATPTVARGPARTEPFHPALSWYGIHIVEALYVVMGAGCRSVTCAATSDAVKATGHWADGRIGIVEGSVRDGADFEVTCADRTGRGFRYATLVRAIGEFFVSGKPPIAAAETLEILRFIDAADESKAHGGATITLNAAV